MMINNAQPTTPPDFTEQARQLVDGWAAFNNAYVHELAKDDLVPRIASFAAEAATQGQIIGIEQAAEHCRKESERMEQQNIKSREDHTGHTYCYPLPAIGTADVLETQIRQLSPDPSYLNRVRNEAASVVVNGLAQDVLEVCKTRGWSLRWTHRGAYLHLESSELIEAIRGKHGDPLKEAADVLLVLMSITENQGIPFDAVLERARLTANELKSKPHYAGEEYDDRSR